MGNKLSCSCAPLIRKAYRYEDSPWQNTKRRDGHLLRLWAEVFHVSASSGAVKWQQVSEDLVPVNITCIQDTPECVFHITAYNSQVVKILDVRLVQPGTRLGQASECFVYWKDTSTGDTWGLNFTSPIDAKQFRECCSPSFKFARKASSSYSLKLEPPKNQQKTKGKKKPQSTPSSPSRGRELQCTCMTAENLHRARNGRVRYTGGAATLPRPHSRAEGEYKSTYDRGRLSAHPSSTSVYDNVGSSSLRRGTTTASVHGQSKIVKNEASHKSAQQGDIRPEQARGQYAQSARKEQAKSVDYSTISSEQQSSKQPEDIQPSSRSKSSDDVFEQSQSGDLSALNLDSNTLKRMLHPLPSMSSTHSSPDQDTQKPTKSSTRESRKIEGEESRVRSVSVPRWLTSQGAKEATRDRHNRSETGRRRSLERTMCLDLTDGDQSPPSDNFLYDNLCYATTPSSSNENSDAPYLSSDEGGQTAVAQTTTSPTSKLLMEYETHLRNALARGLDAESYSLHTFEALLSQSMENVVSLMREVHVELEAIRREENALKLQSHLLDGTRGIWEPRGTSGGKSHTLPLPHQNSNRQLSLTSSMSVADSSAAGTRDPSPSFYGQPSLESADSRIYLTSSEMSDDDRLSLTTAVSDEEDAETRNSPFRARSGTAAASFNCTGAVRKAGFLSVKKWLLRKHRQVELAKKRGWKGYWVSLKGTTLLFYPCDNRDGRAIDNTPKHLIIVDGAIMQPIPEHPKRDYIFCLSTAFGDAYLFQAPCQVELENWINSIHSACAAAFARHRGKTGTLHLLQEEIFRLEKEIES
ncbi:protein still life, isoform SIF type 1-like, partial [Limulus polyphemus]|uniref:Protein still life, isoform SIF type 1-like n=1 Tax=Limulus polyphemus TaxID=6850 RepID=A0ABM1BJY2_LIMPO